MVRYRKIGSYRCGAIRIPPVDTHNFQFVYGLQIMQPCDRLLAETLA